MKLYLSSYKLGKDVSFLQKWIEEKGNNIMVISNALDEINDEAKLNDIITDRCSDLKDLGFNIEILDLKEYFNKNNEFKNINAVYVLGGNVFVLNRAMRLSGFDQFLINKINDDNFLYSGFSAGICVLAEKLNGLEKVVDPEFDPYNSDIMTMEGIGILNYLPVPHYKSHHPASPLIDNVVDYLDKNNLPYKVLHDGDVINETTSKKTVD